jgi:hypothetical protein
LAFFLHKPEEINEAEKIYTLSASDFELISPISGLCPTFRTSRDRQIVLNLYPRILPYISQQKNSKDWQQSDYLIMFRSDDSTHLYKSVTDLAVSEPSAFSMPSIEGTENTFVPVWESKLIHQYDHRFASFSGVSDDERKKGNALEIGTNEKDCWIALPRYWAPLDSVRSLLTPRGWNRRWLCGYRDITNATNERTAIAAIFPLGGAAQPLNIFLPESEVHACFWIASMNSIPLDYVARQRIGGVHLNITTCRQLPIIGPKTVDNQWVAFVKSRVLELVYTSPALEPFARDCGFDGPPFRWDEARRFQLRCELDAAFFHLYGIEIDDVDYIMETFPILKRKDVAQYGSYRTKETILKIYDEMGRVISANAADVNAGRQAVAHYQTHCNPEPGPPADPNGNFLSMYQWDRDNWPIQIHQPHPDWDKSLLAAWFDVCQQQGIYLEDDQIFPRAGRESFVYALIPYLVQEKPGEKFEFYRDAALLVSHPASFKRLLLDDNLCSEYHQLTTGIAWLNFVEGQHIRPSKIREALQGKQIVQTAANSGVTVVKGKTSLPPLPIELMPLLPLIFKAADNLDRLQRGALEAAEAAKISAARDEITNELKTLFAA